MKFSGNLAFGSISDRKYFMTWETCFQKFIVSYTLDKNDISSLSITFCLRVDVSEGRRGLPGIQHGS